MVLKEKAVILLNRLSVAYRNTLGIEIKSVIDILHILVLLNFF
jgi:hypothetical protein